MKIKKQFKIMKEVSELSGISIVYIFFDMVCEYLVRGFSPNNYKQFSLYEIPKKNRKMYFSLRNQKRLIKKLNKKNQSNIFDDKFAFNSKFSQFTQRDVLSTRNLSFDEFERFMEKHPKAIYKPSRGSFGEGIMVFNYNEDLVETYDELSLKDTGVIEPFLEQHTKLDEIYPRALSVIRVLTLKYKNHVDVMFSLATFGYDKEYANLATNGVCTVIDMKDGSLFSKATDHMGNIYEKHPYTNARFECFKVPYFNDVIDMAKEASRVIDGIGYVGWDIAITNDGPVIIEGNSKSGYSTYQHVCYYGQVAPLGFKVNKFLKEAKR